MLTDQKKGTKITKCVKVKDFFFFNESSLTSSFVPAHPAEPRAGPTAIPGTALLGHAPCKACVRWWKRGESLFVGSSLFQNQICAEL